MLSFFRSMLCHFQDQFSCPLDSYLGHSSVCFQHCFRVAFLYSKLSDYISTETIVVILVVVGSPVLYVALFNVSLYLGSSYLPECLWTLHIISTCTISVITSFLEPFLIYRSSLLTSVSHTTKPLTPFQFSWISPCSC